MEVQSIKKIGPLFDSSHFKDVKDPCLVYDGILWHIYGSGGSVATEVWQVLHATAPAIEGPWTEHGAIELSGVEGPHVAAPGVIYDENDGHFHMAIQKDFMAIGGTVEYLVSNDGHKFCRVGTILEPIADSPEAGLYDPHFCIIKGEKYLVYAAMSAIIAHDRPFIPQPDIYLARSTTGLWAGPWERVGQILNHHNIAWHHNRYEHPDYEWGIEGPQIVELPDGRVLINATCFLEEGRRGTRQRVFFGIANDIRGPYRSLGPVIKPTERWESGENGHATCHVHDGKLYLFYQARSSDFENPIENNWRYGIAIFDPTTLV